MTKRAMRRAIPAILAFMLLAAAGAANANVNVDSMVQVIRSACVYNAETNTFDVTVTVTNVSSNALKAPLALAVESISSAGVHLKGIDGIAPGGFPFVAAGLAMHDLDPGESIRNVILQFDDPSRELFSFRIAVYNRLSSRQIELATASSDMRGLHEANPHGVPSNDKLYFKDSEIYDWYSKPRINLQAPPTGWSTVLAWGQIYAAADANAATNVRVEIRDLELLGLDRFTGQWSVLTYSGMFSGGDYYLESFEGNQHWPSKDFGRCVPDVSIPMLTDRVFHFYGPPIQFVLLGPEDMPMMTRFRARLVVDDHSLPDDRSKARIIANAAGDYWHDMGLQWAGTFVNNRDFAISKFKYLSKDFRTFYAHNLNQDELLRNPPPDYPIGISPQCPNDWKKPPK
jgi:hypothetical protein